MFFLGRSCAPAVTIPNQTDTLKKDVQKALQKRDSVKKEIVYKDSIRIKYVVKWRSAKSLRDSIPCDSLLPILINTCDSVIVKDSSEIKSMAVALFLDSIIIDAQQKIISVDSVQEIAYKKEIRKHKRQKRLIAIGAGILLGASLFAR